MAVPVYFVGDTPQGPRLYREFRTVEDDNPLEEAVALMTAGDAEDPDYRTAYPGGSFSSVSFDGDRFVVEVPDDGWMAPGDLSEDEATLALQQLVYTVQGVQQERAPVEVVLDGQATFLFGEDTEGGVSNADPLDVLALVNVTTPEEGAPVSGSFTASGVASSFEATVPWQILTGSGDVELEGFATAEGWMDKLYPWETEIDVSSLDPGLYTFVARTDDPSGGEGGGPTEDTKVIDVS
ncbi:unannotated protein [freshwater metagenome]|uniref:Unannotated protein n=1 Tax=freshwater metagenome TaxID=449393 RepID=A0A6J6RVB0_9ZZZZ